MEGTPVQLTTREAITARRSLGYAEAMANPCTTCDATPCCSFLPLRTFDITSLMDLDYVGMILNFDAIVAGVSSTGQWSAYLRRPCRHLDQSTHGCTVHGTDEQPSVCGHYNPYSCWYREAMSPDASPGFALVDRGRFEAVLALVQLDERRTVTAMPGWDALCDLFAQVPLADVGVDEPPDDPVLARWEAEVLGTATPATRATMAASDPRAASPCDGCSAACCDTLLFPLAEPATMAAVDFNRFSLGFPGVELGVSDTGWSVAVKARCRHFVDGRCSVFGEPERPLHCQFMDAHHCTIRATYGQPRPAGHLRVRREHLPWLEELVVVDDLGAVVSRPGADEARRHVEARWRAAAPDRTLR